MDQNSKHRNSKADTTPWVAITVALLFSVAFYRTAWVTEDTFITFRVVDNTLNGLGLVWNPGERVQAYTHPLWFGLLLVAVSALSAPYFSAIFLSYALLLITLGFSWHTLEKLPWPSLIPILSLLGSKSFIDYSSSGLENPLIHALVASFFWAWLNCRQTLLLSMITSALFLSRPDAIILVAPSMAIHLWRTEEWRNAILGAIPAVVWSIFSLFYYGAPVPNTAVAKVGTGLTFADKATQGINYFIWTYNNDPTTLVILCFGLVCGYMNKTTRPFVAGLLLFALYLFQVGADYMGGRFLSAPVLLAALLAALVIANQFSKISFLLAITVMAWTLYLPNSLTAPSSYENKTFSKGVADERGYYYQSLGLVPVIRAGTWRSHPWFIEGNLTPGIYIRCYIGITGFSGGPGIHWIDPFALTEPFLSRLPSRSGSRVGHFERAFPKGYLASVIDSQNQIADPALHALYDDVILATRAPLFDPARAGAIWRLNSNFHRNAAVNFNREAIGLPGHSVQTRDTYSCLGMPPESQRIWKVAGDPPAVTRLEIPRH